MAQYFLCPHCPAVHHNFTALTKHHVRAHNRRHKEFMQTYLPALQLVRLTCVFCHSHFAAKQSILDHYRVCALGRKRGIDLDRLNGVVAWNTDVWLKPVYRNTIVKYLSERPDPKNPKSKSAKRAKAKKDNINNEKKLPSPKSESQNQPQNNSNSDQTKSKLQKRKTPPRFPCPECHRDYKNLKDMKVHYRMKHDDCLQQRFLQHYLPLLKSLSTNPSNPSEHPNMKQLSMSFAKKIRGFYSAMMKR